MHAYANSKAHCTADWGQILINQLFALPSSKTQTAQSRTRKARDVLKCYCKMHKIDGRNIIIYQHLQVWAFVICFEFYIFPTA